MITLQFKLIKSLFVDNKKEIFLIIFGFILCIGLITGVENNIFSPEVKNIENTSEEFADEFNNKTEYFLFSDVKDLDKVMEYLKNVKGIDGVFAENEEDEKGAKIQCGTRLMPVSDSDMVVGKIPKKLDDGQIILSKEKLSGVKFDGSDTKEQSDDGEQTEYIPAGEKIEISGSEFISVAETNLPEGNIVTENDFFRLLNKSDGTQIMVSYIYDKLSDTEKNGIAKKVKSIKNYEKTWSGISENSVDIMTFIQYSGQMIPGLILAVLNTLFVYSYLLERRIKIYSILKLHGITNKKLVMLLLNEFIVIQFISFLIVLCGCSFKKNIVRLRILCCYSEIVVFLISLFLFCIIIRKMFKKQPFELYQEK